MGIEGEELSIFCGILSDAYKDSYLQPYEEIGSVPFRDLDAWFDRYKKKRRQIEDLEFDKLHFGGDEKISDSISHHEVLFEQMKEYLLPFGVISNGLQLKKAYFAWTWLLKDGVYVPSSIQNRLFPLRVRIDNSPLSKPDEKHIAIQSMAQVIGYLNGYFNIQKMKSVIVRYLESAPTILHLYDWKSLRGYRQDFKDDRDYLSIPKDLLRDLEPLIRSVRPNKVKKGRTKNTPDLIQEIKLIPGLFEGEYITIIHFPKLLRALTCIIFMLVACEIDPDQILCHQILEKYRQNLPRGRRSDQTSRP